MAMIFSLLGGACYLLALLITIRVFLSWIPGLNPFHPLVVILRRIVDPVLAPFRKMLPTFGSVDLSPVLAILTLYLIAGVLSTLGAYGPFLTAATLPSAIAWAVHNLVLSLLLIVGVFVLIRLIMSFFHADPWHPLTVGVRQATDPFVAPFRGLFSTQTSFDAPALVCFVFVVVVYFVADWLLARLAIALVPGGV